VAEYAGERISRREIKRRLKGQTKIHICAIDSYWAVDGSVGGNGTQYINHSCTPNIYIKVVNGRLLFFALRDIKPGEELTLDYVDSYHSDQKRCRCGASTCRRTINLIEQNGHRR
jgi:SET domain-containing protein